MPRHKQVTTCRKSGGPTSKICGCEHCQLAVCEVCGAGEGTLTTDCPGEQISGERLEEILETNLDFTDDRGWHLIERRRTPHFEATKVPPDLPRVDPRTIVVPAIDWTKIDHTADLQHDLYLKALAWALADRTCEDRSAALARIEKEAAHLRGKTALDATERDLIGKLKQAEIDFEVACRKVERCDDESKQLARRSLDVLESQAKESAADHTA